MHPEQFIDVNLLEPPEPMGRILSGIETLEQGCYLRVWIHREPFPLYDILRREYFSHITRAGQHSAFELFIWHAGDDKARELVQSAVQDDALSSSG